MENIIKIKDLKKNYGTNSVLKGINLTIHKGEILALLGVNGAGKTTTLECIEGLRSYDNGTITINGKIGIQLQSSALQSYIKTMEAIKLFAKWNKVEIDYNMLDLLGINDLEKKKYADLSIGQKRRLHLALALISNPDIVFLDEPTAGLDVEGRISLHQQICILKEHGKTIILSSHDMKEVEGLCDRIAVLKEGKITFVGTIEEFTSKCSNKHVLHIKTSQGQKDYETENINETLFAIQKDYKQNGVSIKDIQIDRISLEKQFIDTIRGKE